jgi:hypothetical protein
MVHVPGTTRVTVAPAIVHTDAVIVENVTARPDEAAAVIGNGAEPKTTVLITPNEIV